MPRLCVAERPWRRLIRAPKTNPFDAVDFAAHVRDMHRAVRSNVNGRLCAVAIDLDLSDFRLIHDPTCQRFDAMVGQRVEKKEVAVKKMLKF